MEFLVEFEVEVPAGTPDAEVELHQRAESAAAAKLAASGHLVRLWKRPLAGDATTAIGLYRADSEAELDVLLVHGVLHLLGFDHEKGHRQALAMAGWERKLLGRLSGSVGLIERTKSGK